MTDVHGTVVRLTGAPATSMRVSTDEGEVSIALPRNVFFPAREGDVVFVTVEKGTLAEPRIPHGLLMPMTAENITRFFEKVCRLTCRDAAGLYKQFLLCVSRPSDVGDFISSETLAIRDDILSGRTADVKARVARYPLASKFVTVAGVFEKWYKDVLLRRLYVLGFKKNDLRAPLRGRTLASLYDALIANPYRVLEVPLEQCDRVQRCLRRRIDPEHRRIGQIARDLADAMERERASCISATDAVARSGDALVEASKKIAEYGIVYDREFRDFYTADSLRDETEIAARVASLSTSSGPDSDGFSAESELDEDQRAAAEQALTRGCTFITGRGGTGKTTVLTAILRRLESLFIPYILCAFAGKAVARMRQSTRRPCLTIDAAIARDVSDVSTVAGVRPGKNQVQCVIVDEVSTAATPLVARLMRRFASADCFIFLGDDEQLPSIAEGAFMRECLGVTAIRRFHLTRNHRAERCKDLAVMLKNISDLNDRRDGDPPFRFTTGACFKTVNGDAGRIEGVLKDLRAQGVAAEDVAIVTPYTAYLDQLNATFRSVFYPDETTEGLWFVGARVMQTCNDYDVDVMNGEEGHISAIDCVESAGGERTVLTVEFEDTSREPMGGIRFYRTVRYSVAGEEAEESLSDSLEWSTEAAARIEFGSRKAPKERNTKNLILSFASTIHRYQGSERSVVVAFFPKHGRNADMLTRELVNVAITRARSQVIVVGDIATVQTLAGAPCPPRRAHLGQRIQALLEA